jgi:hypothetical protein
MIRILSVLLLAQLVIVAAVYWPRDAATPDRAALVDGFDPAEVTRIAVSSDEGEAVVLTRDGAGDDWSLDSGLPADGNLVRPLLAALLAQDPGFAIAESASAAERFEVTAETHERRIELTSGSGSATVFLGSSPSYRKIHARRDGDNAVYVIELNSYDAPVNQAGWLDKSLLAARDLDGIGLYGLEFKLEGDSWTRSDAEPVDAEAMETLVQVLASLRVSGLADEDGDDTGEALRIDLRGADGSSRLTVLEEGESERYFLRSDRFEQSFTTSAYDAERLVDAARDLAGLAEEEEEAEADDAEAGAGALL